ncbi:type II toxin-antitoxin system PemK/MazF family toxin [Nocardioides campestrisoli]|uniref:type II toxin-antitoxin system PemK/MazF family toxin n=1 Tax=Nocardioides campestrisoli TaxID=2736757 RepID=UPI00163DDBE9|nr:type II toxin-antitoxin system PemK/MazF family toxin [Nocardioides campestrisoli]
MGLLRRALDVLASRSSTRSASRPGTRPGASDRPVVEYAARRDGAPDPGEVVWAWVAYEDDPRQGKDRPVLLLGRDAGQWVGLMLSSQDHDRDAEDEARWGRHWMDVGVGDWDRQRRPSEVRLDRLLRLEDGAIRREGGALDRNLFDMVAAEARRFHDLD